MPKTLFEVFGEDDPNYEPSPRLLRNANVIEVASASPVEAIVRVRGLVSHLVLSEPLDAFEETLRTGLTNVHLGDVSLMWFIAPSDEDGAIQGCGVDEEQGERPEWLQDFDGYHDAFMDCFPIAMPLNERGHAVQPNRRETFVEESWLLQYGIAPGQPFLVRLDRPEWHQCGGGYYDPPDYDVEYKIEIIGPQPWPAIRLASAWEDWLLAHRSNKPEEVEALERALSLDRG